MVLGRLFRENSLTAAVGAPAPAAAIPRGALAARLMWGLAVVAVCLLGAEVAARLDDAVFHSVPFFANPRYEDLIMRDWFGRRGRPHAQFRNWKLNSLGFRGPETWVARRAGCARVVVMGASETFGYYESPGHEYPRLLGEKLAARGCVEVINTAVIGMQLASMRAYWTHWVARLNPDVVLIYPSPLFYLESSEPVPPTASPKPTRPVAAAGSRQAPGELTHPFESRFIKRLRGMASSAEPRWVQMYFNERRVRAELTAQATIPEIRSPPSADLENFRAALTALVESIRVNGPRVVLLTHAQRATLPLERRTLPDLWEARIWAPHTALPVFVEFNLAGNQIISETARQESVQLIDVARALNGCWDCFGDLNHFDDKGSEMMTNTIAQQLRMTAP
jgi:hypothetical protein